MLHFTAIADATELPVMLYDIPPRSVIPIELETLQRLAEHPRILAVKDARNDLRIGTEVMATTKLAYYSGDDPVNLPWLAVGAVGFVSVIGHVVADRLRVLVDAFEAGELARAREINAGLLPVQRAMGRVGGAVFVKTALRLRGLDVGDTRLPLPPPTEQQVRDIAVDLHTAGVPLGPDAYRRGRTDPHPAERRGRLPLTASAPRPARALRPSPTEGMPVPDRRSRSTQCSRRAGARR